MHAVLPWDSGHWQGPSYDAGDNAVIVLISSLPLGSLLWVSLKILTSNCLPSLLCRHLGYMGLGYLWGYPLSLGSPLGGLRSELVTFRLPESLLAEL